MQVSRFREPPDGNRGRARSMNFTRRRDRLAALFADDEIELDARECFSHENIVLYLKCNKSRNCSMNRFRSQACEKAISDLKIQR